MGGVRPPLRPGGPGTFGAFLREQRIAAGLSLAGLSATVHYSKSLISKIENGARPPTVEFARRCDAALGARGALAGLAAARGLVSPLTAVPEQGAAASPPGDAFGYFEAWLRELRAAAGVSATGATSLTSRARGTGLPASIARLPGPVALEGTFKLVREFGRSASPGSVLPLAVALLYAVRSETRLADGGERAHLLRLGARVAMFAGWMAQEAGDDRAAAHWSDLAASLAEADGDTSFADYARVRKALIALYRGDAGSAVALAAATRARSGADPLVRGLAAQREAQGYALAGDERACMTALETAASFALSPVGGDDERWFGSAAVPDMTELVTGWCQYDLGRPAEAAASLEAGLRRVPEGASRSRARFAVRQALAQAAGRDLDQACDTVARTLPALLRTDSATIRTDVSALSRQLGRWRSHPAVRELQPAITMVLLSVPAAGTQPPPSPR